jgi:hypothetical protein
MVEIIAKLIFGGSLAGITIIAFKKTPILIEIPEEEIEKISFKKPFVKLTNKIRSSKFFSSNLLFQRILSKIKIITLIVERKTEDKLINLREEAKKKKDLESDNYWEKLRTAKKEKE